MGTDITESSDGLFEGFVVAVVLSPAVDISVVVSEVSPITIDMVFDASSRSIKVGFVLIELQQEHN